MESYKNSSSQIKCGESLEIVFLVLPKETEKTKNSPHILLKKKIIEVIIGKEVEQTEYPELLIKEIIVKEVDQTEYPVVKVLTKAEEFLEILHTQHDDSNQKFWKYIRILDEN